MLSYKSSQIFSWIFLDVKNYITCTILCIHQITGLTRVIILCMLYCYIIWVLNLLLGCLNSYFLKMGRGCLKTKSNIILQYGTFHIETPLPVQKAIQKAIWYRVVIHTSLNIYSQMLSQYTQYVYHRRMLNTKLTNQRWKRNHVILDMERGNRFGLQYLKNFMGQTIL